MRYDQHRNFCRIQEGTVSQHLKAVLVGCGSMSRTWIKTAAEIDNFDLVGFVDISEAAARTRARSLLSGKAALLGIFRKDRMMP